MNPCVFCSQINGGSARAPWNQAILESENFLVVPSLGSLVAGWTLLLPKRHYLSMGALPNDLRNEAESLQSKVECLLRSQFHEPLVAFEHGPSAAKHGTGCGVDHAHLHILPIACELLALASPFVPYGTEWKPAGWEERAVAYNSGLDYLFLKQDDCPGVISVASDFGSQVFRKAIAAHLGKPAEFNWREHPRHEVALQTTARLRSKRVQTHNECEHA
jgi:ATP adenylyltransferase